VVWAYDSRSEAVGDVVPLILLLASKADLRQAIRCPLGLACCPRTAPDMWSKRKSGPGDPPFSPRLITPQLSAGFSLPVIPQEGHVMTTLQTLRFPDMAALAIPGL